MPPQSILIKTKFVFIRFWTGSLANRFNHYGEGHRTQNNPIELKFFNQFQPDVGQNRKYNIIKMGLGGLKLKVGLMGEKSNMDI